MTLCSVLSFYISSSTDPTMTPPFLSDGISTFSALSLGSISMPRSFRYNVSIGFFFSLIILCTLAKRGGCSDGGRWWRWLGGRLGFFGDRNLLLWSHQLTFHHPKTEFLSWRLLKGCPLKLPKFNLSGCSHLQWIVCREQQNQKLCPTLSFWIL